MLWFKKKKVLLLTLLFMVGVVVAAVYINIQYSGADVDTNEIYWCEAYYLSPTSYPNDNALCPLLVSAQYFGLTAFSLLLSLLPLLFTRESIYRSWRMFALWYWIIVLGLILLAPGDSGHDYVPMGVTREETALAFSILFVLISWVITLVRCIQLRKK